MAGHSKWANIQHRKGAQDKKKATIFAKLAKEITVAAKLGGGGLDSNSRLRLAVTTARGQSMPKDNIDRAIKKGTGAESDSSNYEEIRYEGYGINGVALIIECLSDNRNRTASEVRSTLSKKSGNLGETGSVAFGFSQLGEVKYPLNVASEDDMLEVSMDVDATNYECDENEHTIFCDMKNLNTVATQLQEKFGESTSAKITWVANNTIDCDLDTAKNIIALVDALENLDDVQNVYTNMEVSDSILAEIEN